MTIGIVLASCGIVIGLMAIRYERESKKIRDLNRELASHNMELINFSEDAIFKNQVLIGILDDHFDDEEINKMFKKKKDQIVLGDDFDGIQ